MDKTKSDSKLDEPAIDEQEPSTPTEPVEINEEPTLTFSTADILPEGEISVDNQPAIAEKHPYDALQMPLARTPSTPQSKLTVEQRDAKLEPVAGFILYLQEKNMVLEVDAGVFGVRWDVFDKLEELRMQYAAEQTAKGQTTDPKNDIKNATIKSEPWRYSQEAAANKPDNTRSGGVSTDQLAEETNKAEIARERGIGMRYRRETVGEEISTHEIVMPSRGWKNRLEHNGQLRRRYRRVRSLAIEYERGLVRRIKAAQQRKKLIARKASTKNSRKAKLLPGKRIRLRGF